MQLDKIDHNIINGLQAGRSVKELEFIVYRSKRCVQNRIMRMKEAYGCRTLPQLMYVIGRDSTHSKAA